MVTLSSIAGQTSSIEMLVQQYMALERRPVQELETKKASLNTKIGVFTDLKSKLDALESIAEELADTTSSSIFNAVQVASDDTDTVTATAGSDAAQGQYVFRIRQLATATGMKSTADLNTNPSVVSSSQVVAGSEGLDTDEAWADAGFDTTPDGTVTINGAKYSLSAYDSVDDFLDAINDSTSMTGWDEVVSGAGTLDTSQTWALAGFDTTPDGTVTINGVEFTLSNYTSVDDFMDAVNDHESANASISYDESTDKFTISSTDGSTLTLSETGTNGFLTETNITGPSLANIYYDTTRDKFFIESTDGSDLVLSETSSNGFLTEVNIRSDTYTTNESGLNAGDYLYQINFDNGLSESDSGSFKINGTTIEWDADTDTLNSIISAINHSDAGVTAFYDDTLDRVVITSDTTGSEEIEWEDVTGSLLGSTLKFSGVTQSVGQDALFTINSSDSADEITKSSNTFTINGLSFTLKATTVVNDSYADPDTTTATITSEKDESALRTKINSFLSKYNAVVDYISTKTAVDVTTYTRGALAGEAVFGGLKNSIVGVLLGQVSGLDSDRPSYLAEIGITLDNNLHASISDSSVLSDWLDEDPTAVSDLFNSTYGVASQMLDLLEPYTESYGIIDDRKESIYDNIDLIDDRIDRLEARLARRETYYRQQFSAIQEVLSLVNYQQSVVSSLTSAINSYLGLS